MIELVDFARSYISYDTAADALEAYAIIPSSGVVNLVNRNSPAGYWNRS